MKYIELTVHTTSVASELVADAMWEYSDFGVAVSDFADVLALQKDSSVFWDYMDESVEKPRADVLVKCFLEPANAQEQAKEIMQKIYERKALSGGEIDFGTLEETKREIDGDDWIDIWKKHFRPIHLGYIVVVPEWIDYWAEPDEKVVLLDSNMAFGTGEHETTAMCVELMQDYLKAGDVVLDVGCGSGILGISAAKLGASLCYLTDLDPVAVQSAKHNAFKNGVDSKVVVSKENLVDDTSIKADLILANITAEVLCLLAPAVPARLKEGGTLILSGVIKERLPLVRKTYMGLGLEIVGERNMGEWYALVLRK